MGRAVPIVATPLCMFTVIEGGDLGSGDSAGRAEILTDLIQGFINGRMF